MTMRGFLVTTVLLLPSCGRTVDATVRDGDIIFQESRSDQSLAIQLATHSSYSHMGLILFQNGQPFVLEAIAHVQLTPLREWTARGKGGRFVVKRLRDASVLSDPRTVLALKITALSFVGKSYDPYFEWSDERIYCSELVWKAFERSLGIRLGALAPLGTFDLSDHIVKAKLARRFGDKVPLGEPVISPVSILNSPLLQGAP